jgi:hypothetical protein
MWEREECVSSNASPTCRAKWADFDVALPLRPHPHSPPQPEDGASFLHSLLLLLRRLDEIERKLDCILDELRPPLPSAIRYAGAIFHRRADWPKEANLWR